MAGNKSNLPPMNGIDFGSSDIEKIAKTHVERTPLTEQREQERIINARKKLQALQSIPAEVVNDSPVMTRELKNAPNTIVQATDRIQRSMESRIERANLQAQNTIGRQFEPGRINTIARQMSQYESQSDAALAMSAKPYNELQGQRDTIQRQIQRLGTQSASLASGLFTKEGGRNETVEFQLGSKAQTAGSLTQKLATVEMALKQQEHMGRDPQSRMERIFGSKERADKIMQAESISREINQTGGVSIGGEGGSRHVKRRDIGSEIISEAGKLQSAFQALEVAAKSGAENLDEHKKKINEHAENLEKLQKAQSGGGGSWMQSGASMAMAAGGIFNAVGGAIQQIGVGQRLGQVGNISGFAGIENQKYDMYKAARGGDVESQLLLGQYGEAEGFGKELKTAQNIATGAYVAGGVAQGVAGGLQIAEGSAQKVNPLAYATGASSGNTAEILAGAQNLVQGGATAAVGTMDLARGVSGGAAQIQGTQAQMEARRALLHVSAQQLQGFRDFSVGAGTAAQQMGGRGESFLNEMMSSNLDDQRMMQSRRGETQSKTMLERMSDARMSPEQFNQLAAAGANTMGSQFSTGQVFAARGLERSGMGTMQENMQRMSTLAGAGANNPQAALGSVMEAAFTKGLDSSKAITMMVENTAAMVQASGGSTAAGINTTAASAALLSGSIDPNQKNQEFAVSRAMTAQEVAKNTTTDTSVSFAGMVNTARISKSTGLGGTDSIFAAQLSPADIRSLQGMDPAAAREALLKKGVDAGGAKGGVGGFLDTMLTNQTNQMFTGNGSLALGSNEQRSSLTAKAVAGKSYSDLTDQEKKIVGQIGASSPGKLTGEEYFNTAAGLRNAKNDPNAAGKVDAGMKGDAGSATLKSIDDLRTSGFKQLSEAAQQATANVGNATKTLKALGDLVKGFEKAGAAGAEGKFSTAAADSAESFGKSTMQFHNSVELFSKAITSMNSRAGLGAEDVRTSSQAGGLINKVQDNMSKAHGRGGKF